MQHYQGLIFMLLAIIGSAVLTLWMIEEPSPILDALQHQHHLQPG
jgi:hypothetical protein